MKQFNNRPAVLRRRGQGALAALLASSLLAVVSPALAQCPDRSREEFDQMRSPLLPTGWVASQGVNVTGAPLWVTSAVTPFTAPNDVFSTAPDNLLDNRLDTPVFTADPFGHTITFRNNYNLESGRDGAVLEISSPNINGGAFTDITDPAVGGAVSPGYNTVISSAFQSPIGGRMAWSGNSGGYVLTQAFLGMNAILPPNQARVRFRLVSDNSGASQGWRIDSFVRLSNECPSPTPTATASPTPTATATPIASPCGNPNVMADPTFEAGRPWTNWTVQTSTNFGTPLCDRAACGTVGGSPYAGDNWAWFGGANVPETATLGQSVQIMAGGTPTLSFVLSKRNISPPFTDVLNVRVDGTIVRSYQEAGQPEASYSLRTIDLSAFADGGSHLILFEYIGPSTSLGSYLVDNVTLTNGAACPTPPPTVTPTATVTLTPSPTIPLPSEPPCPSCPPSPTPTTPPVTVTPSPTVTPTATATATATIFPTATPSASDCGVNCTPAPPPTATATATPTPTPTPTVPPTPSPTPSSTPAQALNISTRLRVETGERVMIGGFIVTGTAPKKVAIRGVGPSLANAGLSDVLVDPTLELRDSNGALVRQNDNWQDDPAQAAELTNLGLALADPRESGMVTTLDPGAYTAIIAGKNQTSGIALVEIYDADAAAASQLANLSTRGFVQTGDNVMIGGFILGNSSDSAAVAVRGIGPSLGQLGLSNVLADPTLELRDSNGDLLIANDNWQDDPASAAQLTAQGLAPQNLLESGIFASLPPGLFTAILAGKNGGIGLGLVEIYAGLHASALTVTNTADSGAGSLRQALADANPGDTIQFAPALNGQTIVLSSGELVIDKSITITGPGPNQLAVHRSTGLGIPEFRIFHIMPGRTVLIDGLTISNGAAGGGGILNEQATLTLDHCTVSNNTGGFELSGTSGGGISNFGTGAALTIVNSTITGNALPVGGQFNGTGNGAGIYNNGTLAIDHSAVSGNHFVYLINPGPMFGGDGAGIYSVGGTVTISNSSVSGNRANRAAGGIFNGGSLEVTNSTISGNGALYSGGGIGNSGTVTLSHSTLSGNSAYYKWFGLGGGIANGGTLEIHNSTLSGNSVDGGGGGISNSAGTTTITHSTLTDNFSTHTKTMGGGALRNEGGGTLQLQNTILNASGLGGSINNISATVISQGYNLSSDNGGGFLTGIGDQINTNPILGPLQNNGGTTLTHALLMGSPAINAGDPNFAPPPVYDQRGPGYDRVVGERIDIGSFELQP